MTATRGRGPSATQVVVIIILAVVAGLSVFGILGIVAKNRAAETYNALAKATRLSELKALANLALNESEIQAALQVVAALTPDVSQSACDAPKALECHEVRYTSSSGDRFALLLAGFSNHEDAIDFGIATELAQEQQQHAARLAIPAPAADYRWLDTYSVSGMPAYSGGATQNVVGIHIVWSRTPLAISSDEAVQAFGRLLDAQTRKIRQGAGP
jgi:hypothetical protein